MMTKVLVVVMALLTATMGPAWSGGSPVVTTVPHPAAAGVGAGPWIVGGTIVSALSLIVCAKWVGINTNKEMTSQQAIWAALLPFSCFWWTPASSPAHHP
jgi:hypothetical protein